MLYLQHGNNTMDGTLALGIRTNYDTLYVFCENWYNNASNAEKLCLYEIYAECLDGTPPSDFKAFGDDVNAFDDDVNACNERNNINYFHIIIKYILDISNSKYKNMLEDENGSHYVNYRKQHNHKIAIINDFAVSAKSAIYVITLLYEEDYMDINLIMEKMSDKENMQQFLELCKFITNKDDNKIMIFSLDT